MGRLTDQLEADKAVRNEARRAFDTRLAQVRQDLNARGIGKRITDKLGEEAREIISETIDVASESKGIIAGTLAALALWFFRNPIVAWIDELLDRDKGPDIEGEADSD